MVSEEYSTYFIGFFWLYDIRPTLWFLLVINYELCYLLNSYNIQTKLCFC